MAFQRFLGRLGLRCRDDWRAAPGRLPAVGKGDMLMAGLGVTQAETTHNPLGQHIDD